MRVKSYYANSVEAAISRASAELGADAVLVQSRRSSAESRHLGPYEVLFELPHGDESSARTTVKDPIMGNARESQVSFELVQVRRQIEEIRRELGARRDTRQSAAATGGFTDRVLQLLLETAMDERIAQEVADAADVQNAKVAALDDTALSYFLRMELARRLPPDQAEEDNDETAPVFAFIGPPGSGKTSSLIKLAVLLQSSRAQTVRLISTDTFRIGAADQLRQYGGILGVSVDVADSPGALRRADEHRKRGPVLIDTPGLSGTDFELVHDLADALGSSRDIRKVLVLPATMRARDMHRVLDHYALFHPDCHLFTHLDETDGFGALYSAAVWSGLPVAYLSAGQQIPDDLERADPARLLDLVLGPEAAKNVLVN